MSAYKIKLIIEGMEKYPMEGHVYSDEALDIRDALCEAIKKYEDSKEPDDESKKSHRQIDGLFYNMDIYDETNGYTNMDAYLRRIK